MRNEDQSQQRHKSALRTPHSALESALALYRGHFLAEEEDKPWAVSYRERLRNKFLQAVNILGELHEQSGETLKAIACYEQGLEKDDLAEALYFRLMRCNLKLGRKAEALAVYGRCRRTLHAAFGAEPSEETEALMRQMRVQTK